MADYMLPFQPSLAQATNTRVDSACKHIQQCRVSTDDMMRFVGEDREELQSNKYRYCVHKDEAVIGVGRPWDTASVMKRTANSAYPKVVSNLGTLGDNDETRVAINMIRFMNHYARTIDEKQKIIRWFQRDQFKPAQIWQPAPGAGMALAAMPNCEAFKPKPNAALGTKRFMSIMADFNAVGFANTLGYAHPNTGDTMTSVMIGGLRTVMNGDFEIFAGDPVQFYWSCEKDDFTPDGRRKPYLDGWDRDEPGNIDPSVTNTLAKRGRDGDPRETWQLPQDARIRQANYELGYGQKAGVHKLVARVKAYYRDEDNPRIYDWVRVFGTAISSARPHEMVDIKISRQSL